MGSDFLADLRYAARAWRRAPGWMAAAVLTLALGIGVSTAIFSLVEAVVLRPLPFRQSQEIVAMLETSRQFPQMSVAWPNYLDWRGENHVFSELAAVRGADMILILDRRGPQPGLQPGAPLGQAPARGPLEPQADARPAIDGRGPQPDLQPGVPLGRAPARGPLEPQADARPAIDGRGPQPGLWPGVPLGRAPVRGPLDPQTDARPAIDGRGPQPGLWPGVPLGRAPARGPLEPQADARPAMVLGARVTASYFPLLGVAPALGRAFLPAEDRVGAPDVVVVSWAFWRERMGGDPHALGQAINLDGRLRTVVGVMPAGFPGLVTAARAPEFWTPLGAAIGEDLGALTRRGNHAGLLVLGRLRPGVSLAQAGADMAAVAHGLAQQYPATNAGNTVAIQSYRDFLVGDKRPAMWLLLGAVGLVLFIACLNVSNLLLARAAGSEKEQAIRAALGASRGRILRQHLAESFGLGAVGGAAGLLLALGCLRAGAALAATLPRGEQIALDGRVLAFAVAVTLLAVVGCGLAPAWQLRRAEIAERLGPGKRVSGGGRLRSLLVVGEMALALVLLAGAGLLLRSLAQLDRVDPGFHPQGVLTFILGLPDTRYPTAARQLEFFRQADARLEQLPGVAAAGGVFPLPLGGDDWQAPFLLVGRAAPSPGHEPATDLATVRGDYFGAMGIRLLQGRGFSAEEDDGGAVPAVAIVDDAFARRYAGLGQQINLDGQVRTIVGIVAHVVNDRLDEGAGASVETYIPQAQTTVHADALYFVLRARGDHPMALRAAALGQIAALDPDQPVTDLLTMDQRLEASLAQRQQLLELMGAFAGLALLLGAVGIYGVISFVVAQRTQEIGIRMALGARRGRVMRLVLGQGLGWAAWGAGIGVGLSLFLTRYLSSLLFGVSTTDPLTLAAVAALLLAVAAAACYLPARRAGRLDPLVALRRE